MRFKITSAMYLVSSMLLACNSEQNTSKVNTVSPATLASAEIPANAPRVGTSIQNLVKPPDNQLDQLRAQYADYTRIEWENLELPGQGMSDILKKYQSQIEKIREGDPKEKALLEQMQQEMNNAPVNPALNGKKVKLPGFVTPLEVDEQKGMVKEFLLVPYFGSCIHIPPPPLNNTILVKPLVGRSIGMERVYEPVWVYGTLSTDTAHTDLADAGYQLVEAKVEMYEVDKKE